MSLLNKKAVKQFYHDKNRRITLENILWGSIRLARGFKTIKDTEINMTSGK